VSWTGGGQSNEHAVSKMACNLQTLSELPDFLHKLLHEAVKGACFESAALWGTMWVAMGLMTIRGGETLAMPSHKGYNERNAYRKNLFIPILRLLLLIHVFRDVAVLTSIVQTRSLELTRMRMRAAAGLQCWHNTQISSHHPG
jgi:hypothetical protein